MDQQRKRLAVDVLYLGGATIAALVVGSLLMRGAPGPVAVEPSASPTPFVTPSASPSHPPAPYHEPDNCPACGMAVRSPRDQDFIERSKQQKKS